MVLRRTILPDSHLRDYPVKSFEISDRHRAIKPRKYAHMWYPKPEIPESLTHHFILENAEYSIESQSKNWKVWVWHEIVLVKISGVSNPGLYPYHFSDFWDIFSERKDYWNRIYFIVDVNNMPVQSEEFLRYVKKNWQNLIERDDFCLCIVESKATKRTIWTSTFRLLGIQEKIHLFENHDQGALRQRRMNYGQFSSE